MARKRSPKKNRAGRDARRATVLIVDDNETEANATKQRLIGVVRPISRTPDEVTNADLEQANLVLVDFKLENWPVRDGQPTPSLKPQDGIALSATLRSNLKHDAAQSPTAFALHSGKLAELSGTLSPARREHAIARMLDLEWVFPKGVANDQFPTQVRSLALAVQRLPHPWPKAEHSRDTLIKLLAMPRRASWFFRAIEDVEKAYPPQDVHAETSKGIAVIRWLLQEILPFPNFLLDERYLAVRLHVAPQSLRHLLTGPHGAKLRRTLHQFRYTGLLHDFSGSRWWRAGIEHWLWRETGGRPFDKAMIKKVVKTELSRSVQFLGHDKPVVTLDHQFCPTDVLIELASAVQINPDDWPVSADPAWASVQQAKDDPFIGARVIEKDRGRLA